MNKLRYAIAGFGGIAVNRIAKEGFALDRGRFEPLPLAELVGATDISPARRTAAESLGLKWYDSQDALFADSSIDAVFVASNNLSHAPLAKRAMEAGKHVLLEKPMATRLEDAAELTELAARRGLSLSVDHMMLHNSYNRKAREVIARGELGDLNDITLHMEFYYGSTPEEAAAWRCADPEELGGPIGDVASHCFYMGEFLTDSKISEVSAVYTPRTMDIRAENGAFIKFRTSGGLSGTVRVSFNDPRGNLESTLLNLGYEVYGTKKVLRAYGTLFQLSGHAGEPIRLRIGTDKGEGCEAIPVGETKNIYQQIILEHAESILTGKRLTGSEGVHNLRLVLASHESARSGGKIIVIQ